MKKGDYIWTVCLLFLISLFIIPQSRTIILSFTGNHPYLGGFIQFAILSSMGDILGKRIATNLYDFSTILIPKAILWGIIGCMVTLVFPVYMSGAASAQNSHLLPFDGVKIATAFLGSSIMNLTFAPVMNTFHRVVDLWIDRKKTGESTNLIVLLEQIDWINFVTFNWLKIGIGFWIPVHTIVFMLPENIRVVVAAFSSISLGVILSFAAKKSAV